MNAADSAPWTPGIEDVNRRQWDYAELHRLVGGVDVDLPPPYHMVVTRDGAVGLPVLAPTKDIYSATEQFNRCFAALLVGGVYCEAVNPDGLEFGSIIDWTYLRIQSGSQAAPNVFHRVLEVSQLLFQPLDLGVPSLDRELATARRLVLVACDPSSRDEQPSQSPAATAPHFCAAFSVMPTVP